MLSENCSELEELNFGKFTYKTGLNTSFSLRGCPKIKKLIISDASVISSTDYSSKIAIANRDIEILVLAVKNIIKQLTNLNNILFS